MNGSDSTNSFSTGDDAPDLLCKFLEKRELPCPRCGYNLRGLTSSRCPECGDELALQVGLVEPRMGAYITLLAACCVGLGGSALFTGIALLNAPSSFWFKASAILMLVQLVLTAAALPLILLLRRWIRRARLSVQWFAALTAVLLVVGLSIAIVVTFAD